MSTKIVKYISVGLLVFAFMVFTGGVANATTTVNANAITNDGVLTITGADVSVWSVASAAADDNLTVGITGATASSLILSSTGTGANAMQITTSAGGLDISVTGTAAGEDLDIDTVGAATEMRLTSASTEDDALVLSASADTGGVFILAGDGEVAAVGTDESIELRATADTIVALTAAGSLVIDGATTDQANTGGALDIDVDTITASAIGVSLDFQVGDAAAANTYYSLKNDVTVDIDAAHIATVYGNYVGLTVNHATGVTYGIAVEQAAAAEVVTAGILVDNLDADDAMTSGILLRSAAGAMTTAIDASDAEITTALSVGANVILGTTGAINLDFFDVAATTGAVTLTQQTVATSPLTFTGLDNGTAALLDINVSNVSGTLIDVDYVAETQTGDLTGLDLNLNTNVTGVTDFDVTGVNVQTPALTPTDTLATTTYTAYNISAAGALDTATGDVAVATLNWRGVNVTMPAIDSGSTLDVVSATGVLISAGTVTNGLGTENSTGIDVSDTDIVNAINIGDNPIVTGNVAGTIGDATTDSWTFTTDGTGTGEIVLPLLSIAGAEMVSDTVTETQLAATITFANADLVSFASVSVTDATEGLLLPQHATTCAAATAEGQVCWDVDSNVLYVGDGAAAAAVAGSTGAANTWTDNQIYTFGADEDIAIDAATTDTTVTTGVLNIDVDTITASAIGASLDFQVGDAAAANSYYSLKNDVTVDIDAGHIATVYGNYVGLTVNHATGVTYGMAVEQADAAELVTAGILVDNLDVNDAMTNGILLRSAAGTMVDGVDASDDELTNAINIGANVILGTTGTIAFTDFTVGADGNVGILSDDAGDALTITLAAADLQAIVVNAATAVNASVDGLIDLNIATLTDGFEGINIDLQVDDDAGIDTVMGAYLNIDNNATTADDVVYGVYVNNEDGVAAADALIYLNQADTDTAIADGIFFNVAAGAITDAIDASDTDIVTALNAGANDIVRTGQQYVQTIVGAKIGTSGAGWVIDAADNIHLATLPASQTAETMVIPVTVRLKVGETITAFSLIGQIESAGGAVTLDADLRKHTAAAADVTDASVGAIVQIAVATDTAVATSKTGLSEVVAADETFYVLLTGTTAASTDIAIQGITVTVTEK